MKKGTKSQKHFAEIKSDGTVDTNLDKTPTQLPPLEDVVVNLAFWLDMLHHYGPEIMRKRLGKNELSKSEPHKESTL